MTSMKNGDESITDAAGASDALVADDSAAFSWAGDDLVGSPGTDVAVVESASSLEATTAASTELVEPAASTAPTAPAAPVVVAEPEPITPTEPKREPLSNASLVLVGLLAGVYLLYAIGWYIGAGRIDAARGTLLSDFGYHATFWLAAALPPLWFTASMLGTKKTWTRLTALLIGVVLCIPWPFVMVGALGV